MTTEKTNAEASAAPHCSSSGETLVAAMRILSRDIQSDDGVANAAIAEAADRLERLQAALVAIRDSRFCSYENSGSGQYGIGVADGHRYCADVARTAIG
jgi:hypothetical protein